MRKAIKPAHFWDLSSRAVSKKAPRLLAILRPLLGVALVAFFPLACASVKPTEYQQREAETRPCNGGRQPQPDYGWAEGVTGLLEMLVK